MKHFIILPPNDVTVDDPEPYEKIFHSGLEDGIVIEIAGKRTPTIISLWIDILVFTGKAAAAGVVGLYAVRLWTALETTIKDTYDEWSLSLSDGKNRVEVEVNRSRPGQARKDIEKALLELDRLNDQIEANLKRTAEPGDAENGGKPLGDERIP